MDFRGTSGGGKRPCKELARDGSRRDGEDRVGPAQLHFMEQHSTEVEL